MSSNIPNNFAKTDASHCVNSNTMKYPGYTEVVNCNSSKHPQFCSNISNYCNRNSKDINNCNKQMEKYCTQGQYFPFLKYSCS